MTFVICNFTNAIFFWATLLETASRLLKEMNALISTGTWFVAGGRGKVPMSDAYTAGLGGVLREKDMVAYVEETK